MTGTHMRKTIIAIVSAAIVAGALTLPSAPLVRLDTGSRPVATASKVCTQTPWPYLNCVGTPFGNLRIRLVTSDHPAT
jgi:hypothetical protein